MCGFSTDLVLSRGADIKVVQSILVMAARPQLFAHVGLPFGSTVPCRVALQHSQFRSKPVVGPLAGTVWAVGAVGTASFIVGGFSLERRAGRGGRRVPPNSRMPLRTGTAFRWEQGVKPPIKNFGSCSPLQLLQLERMFISRYANGTSESAWWGICLC